MNIQKVNPNFYFKDKFLKLNERNYSGTISGILSSGKNICFDFKNGLLQNASYILNGQKVNKEYSYNDKNNLINVKNNGGDVFVKRITNKIGLNFLRIETINENIHKFFDKEGVLIESNNLSKAISSKFFRQYEKTLGTDLLIEERSKITNLIKGDDGNYYLQGNSSQSSIVPNFQWIKTIFRNPKMNFSIVYDKNDNKINGKIKDINGDTLGRINAVLNKNDIPIWCQASIGDEMIFDLKSSYSDKNALERDLSITTQNGTKKVDDKVYDEHGNIISERITNHNPENEAFNTTYYYERKFDNDKHLLEEKEYEIINGEKVLKQVNFNVYDKRGNLRVEGCKDCNDMIAYEYNILDKNGILRKRATIYDDGESIEEHYNKERIHTKWISKDKNGKVKFKYDYIYGEDKEQPIKTIKKDGNNKILFTIEHSYTKNKEIQKYIDTKGNLIGKQIKHKHSINDVNYYYTNAQGRRCTYEYLSKILDDEYI